MAILKLVECSDYNIEYGILVVENDKITPHDIQTKIYEFKNSYKAYGYSSKKEMKADGYKDLDDLINNECPSWDIDDLILKAFPRSWKVSRYDFNGAVEC